MTLLDIGCGTSHLKEFLDAHGLGHVMYSGLDLSPASLELARAKFPGVVYYEADILESAVDIPVHDYVVMNGLFNFKASMSFEQMWSYMQRMLVRADSLCSRGFAFNVMSTCLDWQREDLFHLPFDMLAGFIDAVDGFAPALGYGVEQRRDLDGVRRPDPADKAVRPPIPKTTVSSTPSSSSSASAHPLPLNALPTAQIRTAAQLGLAGSKNYLSCQIRVRKQRPGTTLTFTLGTARARGRSRT